MSADDRRPQLQQIEAMQKSRVLLYVTGDRPNQETIIHSDVLDHFVEHLDAIGVTDRISLVLYTRGGDGMAAWSLLNLIRMFCDELEVIVPMKAHSAGTMVAIGADSIIMTKQATISPIDPSINHPLAPEVKGAPVGTRASVSVEAVQGYLDLARSTIGKEKNAMDQVMVNLASQVHPLVLGDSYRRRQQTQRLAEKLLAPHLKKAEDRKKVIGFLSSDSGSHDYTLNRREASGLGLNVIKCSAELYQIINQVYRSFREDLRLRDPFGPTAFPPNAATPFANVRAIVESTAASPREFMTEGTFIRQAAQPPAVGEVNSIQVTSEGWRVVQ